MNKRLLIMIFCFASSLPRQAHAGISDWLYNKPFFSYGCFALGTACFMGPAIYEKISSFKKRNALNSTETPLFQGSKSTPTAQPKKETLGARYHPTQLQFFGALLMMTGIHTALVRTK